ncbi:MAG: universal stress protein [Burkholderiaceae bacterium]
MSYKTILTHIDSFESTEMVVEQAVAIAKANEAHVIGLAPSGFASLPAGDYFGTSARYINEIQTELDEAAKQAAAAFEKRCRALDFDGFEARLFQESVVASLIEHAAFADLIVLSQPNDDVTRSSAGPGLVGDLLMEAGRPVLVVPNERKQTADFDRVVVAWDGSRQAGRAIIDAMPLLKAAKTVDITLVNAGEKKSKFAARHGQEPGADVGAFLARHGVNTNVRQVVTNIAVSDALLNDIGESEADLLVMGGYGHSRFREWVLGGTTRAILDGMSVPVLMSH